MPKILSSEIERVVAAKPITALWIYNALDAALTMEVKNAVKPLLDNLALSIYEFSKSLQAPVLSMMRKGMLVNEVERQELLKQMDKDVEFLRSRLDRLSIAVCGKGLNPSSPKQVKEFFYGTLNLPPQYKRDPKTKEKKLTTDREALETLSGYFKAQIFVSHILTLREISKLSGALRSEVDADGRMRTSFNIAGTETGRFSSSSSAFDTGTNLQNQTEQLRRVYVADPGHKLAVFDLKTGESFAVGLRCKLLGLGDAYLRACQGGDLHTGVCKLVWPNLPWGSAGGDKEIAEGKFYRHFSHRDMAKRGGHGTNYYGTPWTMAKHLKVDKGIVEEFQRLYFLAFPEIREWHTWVAGEIQSSMCLVSLMGRRRYFFGRTRDDATLREAIAYDPQSSIADYTNSWLLRVYQRVRAAQLLLQGHDALVLQFRESDEREVVEGVMYEASQVRLGRDHRDSIVIPVEAKTGWNWAKEDPKKKLFQDGNPCGLRDYTGRDDRNYTPITLLDRRIS